MLKNSKLKILIGTNLVLVSAFVLGKTFNLKNSKLKRAHTSFGQQNSPHLVAKISSPTIGPKTSGILGTIGTFFAGKLFGIVPLISNINVVQILGGLFSLATEIPSIIYATQSKRHLNKIAQYKQNKWSKTSKNFKIKRPKLNFGRLI